MSINFDSTTSAAGLTQLNNFFSGNTFIVGVALSAADVTLNNAFKGASVDASKYPHLARYLSHVRSFSEKEQASAQAIEGISVTVGAKISAGGASKGDDSDDGIDLGGLLDSDGDDDDSDSEDLAAKAAAKREAGALEAKKKAFAAQLKKGQPIGKSRIVFEIKPYDPETDLDELASKIKALKLEGDITDDVSWEEKLEECLDTRCTLAEGVKWGEGHTKQPVAFGIFKLIVQAIVQDELVGSDDLVDMMMDRFPDDIQSIEIAAFDKAS